MIGVALALLAIGGLAVASSGKKKPTLKPGELAGAIGKGALGAVLPPPRKLGFGGLLNSGNIASGDAAARIAAANAALAKYGPPQFFQRTFQDYNKPGGWADTLDDTVPEQKPTIDRARMIVPQMLSLRFDPAHDLGIAADGTIATALQTLKDAGAAEVTGNNTAEVRDAVAILTGNQTSADEAAAAYEVGKGAVELYTGDFSGAAKDIVDGVSDWFSANTEEWARINHEKIAIDVAKQIIARIASGAS